MTFSWQEPQPQSSRRPQGKKSKKKRKAAALPPPAARKRPRTGAEREPGAACDVSASPPEGAQAENAWTARAFASSLGVAGAVAEALLDGAAVPAGGEFEFMQSLAGRPDEIEAKLREGGLVKRVAKMLSKGAEEKLKTS